MSKKLQIMGILNTTPDSFSDGGLFDTQEKAIIHAKKLIEDGADIIDIGGESTGPGSKKVEEEEEIRRVIPIIQKIREFSDISISIDTYKAAVAAKAIEAGANMINDVTGLRGDTKMAGTAAKLNCPIILMYSKNNTPRTTAEEKTYDNVIQTIAEFLTKQITLAKSQGVKEENMIIDPGMGQFISAIPEYSFEIITRLQELLPISKQILIGISRKSFLGGEMADRDHKSHILEAIAYLKGASIIRTHDVKGAREILSKLTQ